MKIVATMSLPAVDRLNADRWNATRSCQFLTDEKQNFKFIQTCRWCKVGSGHYPHFQGLENLKSQIGKYFDQKSTYQQEEV